MKKVIVLGCPGSGKTTFAVKLHNLTKLPLYHLDSIWHNPDKTHISREDFDKKLAEIFSYSKWIIDGNYNRTLEVRFQECDTVFFLTCLCRLACRVLQHASEKEETICRGLKKKLILTLRRL